MIPAQECSPMTDRDFLFYAFKGNQAAVDFVLLIARVADVWDNLIDGDVEVSNDAINDAFWRILVELPRNAFYRGNIAELLPVIATGILNWRVANNYERDYTEGRPLEIAHVIRYSIADIAILTACLAGGPEWAALVGPELRLRSQRSDFKEYTDSLLKMRTPKDAGFGIETAEYLKHGMVLFQCVPLGATDQEAADRLIDYHAAVPTNGVVVDMGCGVAGVERSVTRQDIRFFNVTNCVEQKREIERCGKVCHFADYHATGIPGAIADRVVFAESFGYGDPKALLAEAARLLKPDGICVIKDGVPIEGGAAVLQTWNYRIHAKQDLVQWALACGLELIAFETPKVYSERWAQFVGKSELMKELHNVTDSGGRSCVYVFRKVRG